MSAPALPWKHKPARELIRLAWPIAISTLSYALMTLVDTLFVSHLGPSALSGVGVGGVATFTLLVFGFGLLRGVKIRVSQAVGAGREHESGRWLDAGIGWALSLGLVMVAAGQILAPLMHHVVASEATGDNAAAYVGIRLCGAPFAMLFCAMREHRYGIGDSTSPMKATLLANATNITLDYTFIFILDLGVAGAALASVCAHAVEMTTVLAVQLRSGWRPSRPRLSTMRGVWTVGMPTGLQFLFEIGSFSTLTIIIASLGDIQMAAHHIALQVCHFSFLPAVSVGEAASVLAGQAVGAGQLRLVKRVAHVALWLAGAFCGLCGVAFIVGGTGIAAAFTPDTGLEGVEEVRRTATTLLFAAAFFQLADGAQIVARGVLRGTGDVRFPAVIGIVTAWVLTPPSAYLLGHVLGLGALGGWIGLNFEIVLGAFLFWWRLERGGWLGEARRSRVRLREDADRGSLAPAPA